MTGSLLSTLVMSLIGDRKGVSNQMLDVIFAAALIAASGKGAPPPLSPEAEAAVNAALDQAARDYQEDPLLERLRREANAPANISAARSVLDRYLFDYRSARVRDVDAYYVFRGNRRKNKDGSENPPILIYCGMVNAPNRFGALTGWQAERWSPTGIPGPGMCPSEFFETGLFRTKVERVGPVGGDSLERAFDPNAPERPTRSF